MPAGILFKIRRLTGSSLGIEVSRLIRKSQLKNWFIHQSCQVYINEMNPEISNKFYSSI